MTWVYHLQQSMLQSRASHALWDIQGQWEFRASTVYWREEAVVPWMCQIYGWCSHHCLPWLDNQDMWSSAIVQFSSNLFYACATQCIAPTTKEVSLTPWDLWHQSSALSKVVQKVGSPHKCPWYLSNFSLSEKIMSQKLNSDWDVEEYIGILRIVYTQSTRKKFWNLLNRCSAVITVSQPLNRQARWDKIEKELLQGKHSVQGTWCSQLESIVLFNSVKIHSGWIFVLRMQTLDVFHTAFKVWLHSQLLCTSRSCQFLPLFMTRLKHAFRENYKEIIKKTVCTYTCCWNFCR